MTYIYIYIWEFELQGSADFHTKIDATCEQKLVEVINLTAASLWKDSEKLVAEVEGF